MAPILTRVLVTYATIMVVVSGAAISCSQKGKTIVSEECGLDMLSKDIVTTWEPMCISASAIQIDADHLCKGEGLYWYRKDVNDPNSLVVQCKGKRCCQKSLGKLVPVSVAADGEQRWRWQGCGVEPHRDLVKA